MGFLAQGATDVAGAAQSSLQLGTIATGSNVLGNLFSGISASQQYAYQAKVAQQNAGAALMAGQYEETQSKGRYGAVESEQKASQAANGVSVGTGSPLAVRQSTEQVSAMEAARIHYNATREAYGLETQAALDKSAARGAFMKGLYGAGASLLSGAAGQSEKYSMFALSGVPGFGGSGKNPMTLPEVDAAPYEYS